MKLANLYHQFFAIENHHLRKLKQTTYLSLIGFHSVLSQLNLTGFLTVNNLLADGGL